MTALERRATLSILADLGPTCMDCCAELATTFLLPSLGSKQHKSLQPRCACVVLEAKTTGQCLP